MALRQSPKSENTTPSITAQSSNQEIALQLVKGFLASGNSPIMETQPSGVQTAATLLARSNLDSYYIANLYQRTIFWLSK
jgi:hypothetical protein